METGQINRSDQKKNELNKDIKTNDQSKNEITKAAQEQASGDMEKDAELTAHSPYDDLDEEENVRLGEDKTDLV